MCENWDPLLSPKNNFFGGGNTKKDIIYWDLYANDNKLAHISMPNFVFRVLGIFPICNFPNSGILLLGNFF